MNTKKQSHFAPPPDVKKIPKELTIHDDTRIDNYYWLNQREDSEVIKYLKAENEYAKKIMESTEGFQKTLFDEIVGRIKKDDESVPYKRNGYYYYTRFEKGNEYPVYCRKKDNLESPEEILLNVNEMAKGYAYYQLGGLSVSPDNKLIAYGVDTLSRRKYKIFFKDLESGKIFKDEIPVTTGSATWANDNKTIFYTQKDETTLRPQKIFKHRLGAEVSNDLEIYHETDETFTTSAGKTKSEKYIIIASGSTLSTEYRFINANKPDEKFKIIQAREKDLEYSIDHFGDSFYILTNMDAKNFKLMKTPVNKTGKENWVDVIPHRDNVLLEDFEIFNKFLVLGEKKNGLVEIRVINHEDKSEYYLDFGEEVYSAGISVNLDFDSEILRYSYSSLTTPNSTYDYDMNSKEKTLLKRDEVIGDFNPDNYEGKRLWAVARDGVKIPISIVYRKGMEKNADNPLLLYGYGSYGASMSASFSSVRLSLLDRGFIYAIAHIRGGQEMGRYWYEDGKLLKKKNTFTDFIDCGEYLISEKYTNHDKIFADGASAGGLLIGAVINIAPDLFKAVLAGVPFVDVVTTMLDESIPLTTGEFDEWGNPKIKKYYDYMLSYSPYDNVEAKDYPAMLITTGLYDSQVQYFEPAKWLAKLRDLKTDDNVLIMDCNMDVGHGGASGRFKRYKLVALEYAFLMDMAGIKK
ncbi:S9 family peptidase [Bacteroidota bacterium]